MAKTAVINIRMESETKKDAEELFEACGLTLTDAINIFIKKSLNYGGIPFKIKAPRYNKETLAAIREVQEMKKNPHLYKSYSSFDEIMEEIRNEPEDEI